MLKYKKKDNTLSLLIFLTVKVYISQSETCQVLFKNNKSSRKTNYLISVTQNSHDYITKQAQNLCIAVLVKQSQRNLNKIYFRLKIP